MKSISSKLFLFVALAFTFRTGFSQSKLGIFNGHIDIGTNLKAGSAIYQPQSNQYVVAGAGKNVRSHHDELHYVYKKLKGDFILYTRVESKGWNGIDGQRKLGWMIRRSLDEKSVHMSAVVHSDGQTALQYRKTDGVITEEVKARTGHATVIQLERKKNLYTMRVAKFGEPFVVDSFNLDLGDDVYVGLFVHSGNVDVTDTSVFRDVQISVPAREGLVPYREYLGSNIEILEVASGNREVIYTSPKSLQAPNWTPDGRTLIYNSDGLMYTFDLASRMPQVLNTGEVKNNNNDHVLSFDGRMLGLSSGVQALGGSIIYTVPVTGGTPKQITPRGPSYLHGWSPDGKTLVFTGQRNNEFDIYTVPSSGGKEVQRTTAKGLDDGPEYTPDGRYIFFNSNRSGTMRIWRMKADGSDQKPMTDGEFHDWFPHVSPDGKWVVFVSFLKEEVSAGDHPFYKHVYLRLMPITGGKPKVIAYVYGGQGTINTPSWSPDGKHLAFISNSDMPGTNVQKGTASNK